MFSHVRRPGASFFTPPFVVSLVLLGAIAAGMGPLTTYLKVVLRKEPLPLRQPLSHLDKSRMGSFDFVHAMTLDSAVVNTLGTDQYIQWVFEDRDFADTLNPLRFVNVFITYYTGKPGGVAHTPDVCMTGAGYQITSADNTIVNVPSLGEGSDVPVRVVSFSKSNIFEGESLPVVYTFHCNGNFYAAREVLRTAARDPRDKHVYFSKIEVTFGWKNAKPRHPTREQAVEATAKVFNNLLPLLLNEHFPDWEAAESVADADG